MKHVELTLEDIPETYQQFVAVTGIPIFLKLCEIFGGNNVYMPKPDTVIRVARDAAICREFDGGNYKELGQKYGITQSRVRSIIAEQRAILNSQCSEKD